MGRAPSAPSPSAGFPVQRIPFFYGWIMVPVAMAVQIATSPGQTYGISVFNPYLRDTLSLSQSQLSGAYMLGTLLASLPMTYVGHLMDRYGPRRILAAVVVVFGLTCLGMSRVNSLTALFVAFLFLRMLGQGAMSLLAMNSVALWFNRRLGLVSGLMSLGSVAAMGGMPSLHLRLIEAFGWRWTYIILGLGVWIFVLPLLALFFRNRPEDIGQLPDGRHAARSKSCAAESEPTHASQTGRPSTAEPEFTLRAALRTRSYWIMATATAFWGMSNTGIHFHSVQLFLDRGLSRGHAASMFTTFAIATAAMQFIGGVLADRLPLNALLTAGMAGMAAGIALLVGVSTPSSLHVFAGVLGGSTGVVVAVWATIWARYYGRLHLGKIRGSLTTIGVAASSVGPFVMGGARDLFGTYDQSLWLFVGICIPIAVAALWATPPRVPVMPDHDTIRTPEHIT